MVAGAIVATALRIAVIDATVKPFAGGVLKLFVPHSAERHATHLVVPVRTRLLVPQNGVIFFAPDVGALKPDELVVFRVFNDHPTNRVYNMHLHDFINYGIFVLSVSDSSGSPPAGVLVPALVAM